MDTKGIIFGVIIIGVFIAIITSFGTTLGNQYGVTVDTDELDSYNKISTISNDIVDPMRTKIYENETVLEEGTETESFKFSTSAIGAYKLIKNIPSLIGTMVNTAATRLGLPSIIIQAFSLILFILIIYAIFEAFFGGNK